MPSSGHFHREKDLFIKLLIVSFLSLCPSILGAKESRAAEAVDEEVLRGVQLLYQWDTDRAEDCFEEVVARRPKDPAGYFYMSMVSWSRLVIGFWSPEMVREYIDRIDRAIAVAKEQIEDGSPTAWTYFYLGGALGFKGRFHLMERKWLTSFFLAADAVEALKTCQRMDPLNKDVLLGLGIFDYYTAKMSGVLKFLTYLLLHRGDREEGLRKLHIAAREAIYSTWEAKSILLHIYLFLEADFSRALPLAGELANRFPSIPRYKYFEGLANLRIGMDSGYRGVVDSMRQVSLNPESSAEGVLWTRQALYLEAAHDLFEGLTEEARAKLDTLLSMADPVSDPAMVAWPILKRGMSYDLEGRREKALEHYTRVLEMENGAGAQFLAQKYRDNPVRSKDPFIGY
jgi:tetratricopeptide (TPR) repeat protein